MLLRNPLPVLLCILFISCKGDGDNTAVDRENTRFKLLSPDSTNIVFENKLIEGPNTNVLMYEYFYNGGGVAIGDLNGDGLEDIYFTANMVPNQLYLNRGNLKFEDITRAAGVAGRTAPWTTGVTIADVNADNKPDIFVSYSGKVSGTNRLKQLFINQGNQDGIPVFKESAAEYGIIDSSYTTQSLFFDYDLDGDLDLFLLNHNPNSIPILDEAGTEAMMKQSDPHIGSKLYRNDNNRFIDVTGKSGLNNSMLSYGLGAAVSDINGDGWPDLYISNDYTAPDYLYINNKKGGFVNELEQRLGYTSNFSMGNNISDINNDGHLDIYTLDMLPETNERQKLLFAPDNYEKFDMNVKSGLYYQYMRNMLHLNNGDGTFSEIGQLSGVSNTDWSWAPLIADFDNDGLKDLFVTNGYVRDFTNMDFMKYMGDFLKDRKLMRADVLELVHKMPSSSVKNYMYQNTGDLRFKNVISDWGFDSTANSNGAAYADLDNDGDLDLVINNINSPAFIYENRSNVYDSSNYLQVKLAGEGLNTAAIGARVILYWNKQVQIQEHTPNRGFQSSVSQVLHFGLGSQASVDSIVVIWPRGKQQTVINPGVNKTLTISEKDALGKFRPLPVPKPMFSPDNRTISFVHNSEQVNDFKRQPLMINPLSFSGPCIIKGDVNGDGREDLFTGGGAGQPGAIFLQNASGAFVATPQPALVADKASHDEDAVFFDANGDGFPDLYVASGGYHNFVPGDTLLNDRLYLNNGRGVFVRKKDALPVMHSSKGCVAAGDINRDGFIDLFVGGRVIPGRYPEIPESYLLINDGTGKFASQAASLAPGLQKAGMITDAIFMDVNSDSILDLVIAGEWMPVTVFINDHGKLKNETESYFEKRFSGWWNKLDTADFNGDGKTDLLAGNYGRNAQFHPSEKEPAEMYYKDFDDNGSVDPIFCCYINGKSYPFVTRDELLDQMSTMRTRYSDYRSYANTVLHDLFSEEELKEAGKLQINTLETTLFLRSSSGKFVAQQLPVQAQFAPVYAIGIFDYDNDGARDFIIGGNINNPRLRLGKIEAGYGMLFRGNGKGGFDFVPQDRSGFKVKGDIRSILPLGNKILFGVNQQKVVSYTKTP